MRSLRHATPFKSGPLLRPPPPTHCASRPISGRSARRPRRPCSPRCPRRRDGAGNLRGAKRKGGTRPVTPAAPDHHGGGRRPGDFIEGKRASRAPAPPPRDGCSASRIAPGNPGSGPRAQRAVQSVGCARPVAPSCPPPGTTRSGAGQRCQRPSSPSVRAPFENGSGRPCVRLHT